MPVRRPLAVFVVGFVSSVLTVTMVPDGAFAAPNATPATASSAPSASAAKAGETGDKPTDSDGDGVLDRLDTVSAALSARLGKKPVEDMSARTESSSTFANPDGTFTQRRFTSAVRLQDDAGDWQDVDYDLEKQTDGSYAPKVAPADVTVSGGGDTEAASVGSRAIRRWR